MLYCYIYNRSGYVYIYREKAHVIHMLTGRVVPLRVRFGLVRGARRHHPLKNIFPCLRRQAASRRFGLWFGRSFQGLIQSGGLVVDVCTCVLVLQHLIVLPWADQNTRVPVHMHKDHACLYVYIYIQIYMCIYIHIYIYTYIHVYICTHIPVYIYIYI